MESKSTQLQLVLDFYSSREIGKIKHDLRHQDLFAMNISLQDFAELIIANPKELSLYYVTVYSSRDILKDLVIYFAKTRINA